MNFYEYLMQISLVQFCPVLADIELNSNRIFEYIENIQSDIIVFPELAFSGYFFTDKDELKQYAFAKNHPILQKLQEYSSRLNKIIVSGFAELDSNVVYNSAIAVFPDQSYTRIYRKTHLFYKERDVFAEGNSGFFVINYPDWDINIGLMICYDWRFPESARTLALKGADIIICPSNLVTEIWHLVMPARSIENKVYLAVGNRIGTEKRNEEELFFNGRSAVYSYNGKCIAEADIYNETVICAEIIPHETRNKHFNSINHLFNDRRPDMYY